VPLTDISKKLYARYILDAESKKELVIITVMKSSVTQPSSTVRNTFKKIFF